MGMDFDAVRTVSWISAISLLSRLLSELFRRQALRYERRIAPHGRLHAEALVSQLVPAALPIYLCDISVRRGVKDIDERHSTN